MKMYINDALGTSEGCLKFCKGECMWIGSGPCPHWAWKRKAIQLQQSKRYPRNTPTCLNCAHRLGSTFDLEVGTARCVRTGRYIDIELKEGGMCVKHSEYAPYLSMWEPRPVHWIKRIFK